MQTKINKKLWGWFAFSPWLLFFAIAPLILNKSIHENIHPNTYDIGFIVVGNIYFLVVLIGFMIILQKLKLENWKKWFWRVLFVFTHVFAIPLFWYIYIWKDKTGSSKNRSAEA